MVRKVLFCFLLAVVSVPLLSQTTYSRQDYIDMYKDVAISHMISHGIPASITLAQGCLESGDGNSSLAREAKNHFGIKCHNDWNGDRFYQMDDEVGKSCFRKYRNVSNSYDDHSDFLRGRDRYAFLFDLDITDYKGWAYGLKKAGYATNPQYAQMLIHIIEEYKLYLFDTGTSINAKALIPPSPSQLEALKELKPEKSSPLYKFSLNRTIYTKNNVAYVIASDNDTYAGIAKEYNLFTSEILRFNDLKKSQKIIPGTVVYIERKKNKAQRYIDVHVAEKGDTYYEISQRYAVRLSSIRKYNDLKSTDISPREGDMVLLKKR